MSKIVTSDPESYYNAFLEDRINTKFGRGRLKTIR